MSTKHTPAPWRYVRENGSPTTGQHMIASAKPGYLAEVRDCGSGDVQANARLISAAPGLLAAARALVAMTFDEAKTDPKLRYCDNDALNPCWDGRPSDAPGKHWGGGDACPACSMRAAIAAATREAS